MRVLALGISLLLTLGLVGPISPLAGEASAATHHAGKHRKHKVRAAAKTAPKPKNRTGNFHPKTGPLFNDPYNRKPYQAATIRTQAIRSINSAPKGSVIKMAMFNFRSPSYTNALVRAHQRGVQVQFLMFHGNDTPDLGNPDPKILRKELRKGNKGLPAAQRSWIRECKGSCRGRGGITHFKFITFSKVGVGPHGPRSVVMYGSNNATDVAVGQQWNDWFTYTNDQPIYDLVNKMFDQAAKDKVYKQGYVYEDFPKSKPRTSMWFYPYTDRAATKQGDPVMAKLNQITCTGTTIKGLHGHTQVRIAQDAIAGDRGITIAKKVAALQRAGCDIKIVYTLMGGQVKQILTAAHIPLVHYAYDRNGDCEYDMYLHAKDMTVEGTYAGDKKSFVTWNGTANWTPLPLTSDEMVAEIHDRSTTQAYATWINWLLTHRPTSWPADGTTTCTPPPNADGRVRAGARIGGAKVDPYALVKQDD
jgi:phosphatidylserine/phosphatidylglycerophosphate/cardiolipin synthase-like enzyme